MFITLTTVYQGAGKQQLCGTIENKVGILLIRRGWRGS
jgi:hypothetical protein